MTLLEFEVLPTETILIRGAITLVVGITATWLAWWGPLRPNTSKRTTTPGSPRHWLGMLCVLLGFAGILMTIVFAILLVRRM
ncbi:hypothetical protein [Luteococcus sp.]|uniref:hypothetical protein n=1 Tax=Luteococcus sp. TaxID=1969402 RepID=UPI003735D2E9